MHPDQLRHLMIRYKLGLPRACRIFILNPETAPIGSAYVRNTVIVDASVHEFELVLELPSVHRSRPYDWPRYLSQFFPWPIHTCRRHGDGYEMELAPHPDPDTAAVAERTSRLDSLLAAWAREFTPEDFQYVPLLDPI